MVMLAWVFINISPGMADEAHHRSGRHGQLGFVHLFKAWPVPPRLLAEFAFEIKALFFPRAARTGGSAYRGTFLLCVSPAALRENRCDSRART
jgi:hypothetical protein